MPFQPAVRHSPQPRLFSVASSEHPVLPKPPNTTGKLSFNQSKTNSVKNLKKRPAAPAPVKNRLNEAEAEAEAGAAVRAEVGIARSIQGVEAGAAIGIRSEGAEAGAAIGGQRGGGVEVGAGAGNMITCVKIGRGVEAGVENRTKREVKGNVRRRRVKNAMVVLGLIMLN